MKFLVGVALALTLLVSSQAGAGVSVSLQPAVSHVLPDRPLNISVYVDSAGSDFNGYEAVIRWDSSKLQYISWQPDTLFSNHNQWWATPVVWPDSVKIAHVIMEGGVTETGPGALSSITFHTLELGETPVSFRMIRFYRGGSEVLPVWPHEAVVYIETPNSGALDPSGSDGSGARIDVTPNPIEHSTSIRWSRPDPTEAVIRLFNAEGRLLRSMRIKPDVSHCTLSSLVDPCALSRGTYFLEIQGSEGRRQGRFIALGQ
jgi:hypothetical protein